MMLFIEYENDNLPVSNLPYTFKSRLIQLASMDDCNKLSIACPNIDAVRYRQYEDYRLLYITDNRDIYDIAVKEEGGSIDIDWIRRFADGPLTINPSWQSVFLVDDIVADNQLLGISDTLTLFLTSMENYDRLIQFITGEYSRLILYGDFTWAQVERLLHSKVKQVRLMGEVEVIPEDYDHVVKFLLRLANDFDSKISFRKSCFPPELMELIDEACANHESHSLVHGSKFVHFIEKNSRICYFKNWVLSVLVYAGLIAVFGSNIDANYGNDGSIPHAMIKMLFICFALCILPIFFTGFANLTNIWPQDVKVYVKVKYPWMVEDDDDSDDDDDDDDSDDDDDDDNDDVN